MSTKKAKLLRNPAETRARILEVAFNEIYRHGYKGTSTNAIIDKMEMTRGAFFHHFPTKDHLGFALIDEVLAGLIISRWIEPIASYANPVQGILKNFKRLIDEHLNEHILCGCPLNNLIQELSDEPEFQKRLQAVMEDWITGTEELLKQGKRSGNLNKSVNTKQLAEFVVACQESAFSMGKALNCHKSMGRIYKSLSEYIRLLDS